MIYRKINYVTPPRTSKLSMASFNVQQNPISYKLYGDGKRLQEEQLKMDDAPAFIIHPHSNFRIFWDCVTMLVLMINYVYILYSIAFYNDGNTSFHVLFLISDIWFIFDMLINFRTGMSIPKFVFFFKKFFLNLL